MSIIPAPITQGIFRSALVIQKHAPAILFGLGVTGVATSTVLACKATLELQDILDEMRQELDMVLYDTNDVDSKDVAYVYAKNIAKITRLYAPAVTVGAISIGALTGSHVVLTRRNAGLTAAYAALSTAYEEYRLRVKSELGENKEIEIYKGYKPEVLKAGEEPQTITTNPISETSPYARFFDEYSINWVKNAEMNRLFIQCQQNTANQILITKGHLFLNEVYDMLGLDRTSAGAVVGWVIGDRNHVGDNYVDFGIFSERNSRFVNGWERSVLLDFNVDGVIYDKI
jgi:hypothetical protein